MDSILNINNLSTQFNSDGQSVIAVDNISFDLYKGDAIGIVGESGSGKSAAALSIMRLLPNQGQITSGEIYFTNNAQPIDLLSLSENSMRDYRGKEISMIFQDPMTSLNPVFTCGSQVSEAMRLHLKLNAASAKEKTLKLFADVKMNEPLRIYNSFPHQISGGQKQRVMIAMAMSCNPSILIADEPTTSLDVTVQAKILELMNELRSANRMSMIFISHDLGVVAEIANRILVMHRGKIVEQGTTNEIFSNPKHPYTVGLISCRPPLNKRLRRLPVISDFLNNEKAEKDETSNIISESEAKARAKLLSESPIILSVQNLSVQFNHKRNFLSRESEILNAVDNVSFELREGETLGLVGESGCGKTTLGKAILQLIESESGEAIYMGMNLLQLEKENMRIMRRNIQIIFQDPYSSLNPRLTIGYAIMEPMKVHLLYFNERERRERTLELLSKVGLPADSFNRYPHEFSGGERQRICIARALSLNPKLIVCDECVSSLDVSVQAQVLNLLKQLQYEFKLTYIFISHDLSVVKHMSDRIAVMKHGKIIEIIGSEMINLNSASQYTKILINSIPKGMQED